MPSCNKKDLRWSVGALSSGIFRLPNEVEITPEVGRTSEEKDEEIEGEEEEEEEDKEREAGFSDVIVE